MRKLEANGGDGGRPGNRARLGDLDHRNDDVLVIEKAAGVKLDVGVDGRGEGEPIEKISVRHPPFNALATIEKFAVVETHLEAAGGHGAGERAAVHVDREFFASRDRVLVELDETFLAVLGLAHLRG